MTQDRLMTSAGVHTHLIDEGQGDPIVVLHGFSGSADTMRGLATRLARRHRVLSIDLVGHGFSAKPPDPAAYTMDAAAGQVLDVIRQRLDGPAAIVGYSMGGRVALASAFTASELVRGVVLISGTAGIPDPAQREARRTSDERLAAEIDARGIEWFAEEWMRKPFFRTQEALGDDHMAEARAQRMANDPTAMANSLRGMGTGAQPSYWHLLPQLQVPVLFIAGEEDRPFVEIGEQIVAAVSEGVLAVVPDAGHATHLEAEDDVVTTIEHFLATPRGRLFS